MVGRQQLPKEVLRERRAQMRRILNLIESVADKDARTIGDSRENLVRDALDVFDMAHEGRPPDYMAVALERLLGVVYLYLHP